MAAGEVGGGVDLLVILPILGLRLFILKSLQTVRRSMITLLYARISLSFAVPHL